MRYPRMAGLLLMLALMGWGCTGASGPPQVMTLNGRVAGSREVSRGGVTFHAYRSIPYAKPPVGHRRFTISEPMAPWKETLDVSGATPNCLQINYFAVTPAPGSFLNVTGVEDCLYLSVFTPAERSVQLRPVLVYIHGGGFTSWNGATFHGPHYFMDEDLVVVYINYRLGPLGFMTFDDGSLPGNLGLRDQHLGLKWVKMNIARFGGDPSKITMMGESAGAACVHVHMKAKSSRRLFTRAILNSGTTFSQWATLKPETAVERATAVAKKMGCWKEGGGPTVVACLKKANTTQLLQSFNDFLVWSTEPAIIFGPIGETWKKCFWCNRDVERPTSGDLLAGNTLLEGVGRSALLYMISPLMEQLNNQWKRWAPVSLYSLKQDSLPDIFKNVRQFYFGNNDINSSSVNLTNIYSDAYFNAGLYKTFDLHNGKIFQFQLERKPTTTFIDILGLKYPAGITPAAGHVDDLQYLFNTSIFLPSASLSEDDTEVSKRMVHLWANFVKYGEPKSNPTWKPRNNDGQWLAIKPDGQFRMEIDQGLIDRMAFWKTTLRQIQQSNNKIYKGNPQI